MLHMRKWNVDLNSTTCQKSTLTLWTMFLSSVPGDPPENMTIKSKKHSITVEWDRPAAPNGVITKYIVFITPSNIQAHTNDTKYTANGLQPSTTYNITVTAVNCMGSGPPGSISGTTGEFDTIIIIISHCCKLMESNVRKTNFSDILTLLFALLAY